MVTTFFFLTGKTSISGCFFAWWHRQSCQNW